MREFSYENEYKYIRYRVRKMVWHEWDAEDVVQNVMVNCVRWFDSKEFVSYDHFKSWLNQVINHACFNFNEHKYRQKRGRSITEGVDNFFKVPSDDVNPENRVIAKDNLDDVIKKIKRVLSEREFNMFLMWFFWGYTRETIAAVHDTTIGVVSQTIYVMRARLKKKGVNYGSYTR